MSTHKVNIDAIAAGAGAFLLDWPDEPRKPTIPARVHRVLWEDDYWPFTMLDKRVENRSRGLARR